ncbi:GNAT family N-acetyltransferase [Halalkalibacillus halophilus]|uniref:GNAT family N-acetyltransferase n=1 Tax=Halalkalibacillus halophilus TaxID=392827 RepID=UPI0004222FAC|nr:GNAT family N-acetyltransferase [Halalkalibacillus halophilus]
MIREANQEDAQSIAKVHVDSWKTTYKDILPSTFLEKLSYEHREKIWTANIADPNNHIFVYEKGGEVVGFVCGGKRDENQVEGAGDLTAIYLLQNVQGEGIGKQLTKTLFGRLRDLNYTKAFVEVLDDNQSKQFYEKLGAELYEEKEINIAGTEQRLLIYLWNDLNRLMKEH